MVQRNDKEILIFEDDMIVDPDFPALLERRDWIPADAGLVNFSWDMANAVDPRAITSARSLCRFDGDVMRLGSYIIRFSGRLWLIRQQVLL